MPLVIDLDIRNRQALRRRTAQFHSIFDMLARLEQEARSVSNSYDRAERWLRSQGPEYSDLADVIHSFHIAARHQYRRLSNIAEQVNDNWDLALNLNKLVFHDDADPSPLEFGFPVDVIGDPPVFNVQGDPSDE